MSSMLADMLAILDELFSVPYHISPKVKVKIIRIRMISFGNGNE